VKLVGALVNLSSEAAVSSHVADDVLKAVTSGEPIELRYLNYQSFTAVVPTRFIMAMNEMFTTRDTSGAIEERMIILPCDNPVPEADRDTGLWGKLEAEAPGIFGRMVRAWQRLRQRGRFDPPATSGKKTGEFSLANNHPAEWYLERTHQGIKAQDPEYELPPNLKPTEVSMLYLDFAEWSRAMGYRQMSKITMRLAQCGAPEVTFLKVGGKSVRVRAINPLHDLTF